MTLGELRKQTRDLDDATMITLAEIDEVAGFNVSKIETLDTANVLDAGATGGESVEFAGGKQTVLILRY